MRSMPAALRRIVQRPLMLCLLLSVSACGASESDPASALPAREPSAADLTAALRSSDAASAAELLRAVQCHRNSDVVREVIAAWAERDSFTSTQAMHDPLVRTSVATCVLESTLGIDLPPRFVTSAGAELRQALQGSDLGRASEALQAMSIIATPQDIQTIATLGLRQSDLAIAAARALADTCGPQAAAALGRIAAQYPDGRLSQRIGQAVESGKLDRAWNCAHEPDAARTRASMGPSVPQTTPSADDVKQALAQPTAAQAVKTLLQIDCGSSTANAVTAEILSAWKDRESARAPAIAHDPLGQAIMAKCLLWSGPDAGTSPADRTAAAELLRSSIRSDKAMVVITSMSGLTRTALESDAMSIAEAPSRVKGLWKPAIWDIALSCAPDPQAALEVLRRNAPSSEVAETLEPAYKRFEPERERLCGPQPENAPAH
jgi:hypothetical protein